MTGGVLDEKDKVRRAQAGDRDAYDDLIRLYQRAAIRVAATIVGSGSAADAAQEGFLRAYRSLSRFDPGRPFRPWLLHIVANAAKNEVRSSARHIRLEARAREVRIDVAQLDDPAVRSEEREQLVAAIARLSVDDRLVVALRWFEDMTESEMAEVLGVRPGTVKSRLNRAMTRLRSTLIQEEANDE